MPKYAAQQALFLYRFMTVAAELNPDAEEKVAEEEVKH
jgi:hypothetical protein